MNVRAVHTHRSADMNQHRQFAVLYRSFLFRVIDLQLLSATGDIRNLLVQFASLLAAYSFVLTLVALNYFAHHATAQSQLSMHAWGMEEFLISTTLTVAGLFTVLAWNSLLPDRRDSLILDPLPVSKRLIFAAKVAANVTALGISILAVNVFTGVTFPFFAAPAGSGLPGALRCLCAYWTIMAVSGVFILISIISLQAAAAMLRYSFFQRISGLLQLVVFFVILSLFFLTPPLATLSGLSAPGNQELLAFLPSFWFLGLFHVLSGTAHPALRPLATRAIWNLASVCLFAAVSAGFTYRRTIRRVIEQPDIAPQRSAAFSRAVSALMSWVLPDSIDRAILLFSARTLARSREHRLVLAVYVGIAFAISLAFAKSLLYRTAPAWSQPDAPLLIPGVVILFFSLIGTRAVFALPFALSANWIFRITAVCKPARYFSAVRKSLFSLAGIPVLLLSAVFYFSLWPGRPAAEHLLVLTLLSALLVQMSLRKFRKIPFACSYLPGKSNLRIRLGISGFAFLFAVDIGSDIEHWSMQKGARFAVVLGLLMGASIWARRRTSEFAGSPHNRVQFEDVATVEIYALDLRRDADYLNEGDYLDAVSSPTQRSITRRIIPFAVALVLVIAMGFGYERFGEWRDRQTFPRVGRPVDIGGRSLNLFCSGSGSPTVVMDTGGGVPGYGWSLVEPGVAKLTKSCWYDRAGYGWSDPAPHRRTAADIAEDLHKLLHAAGVVPPYLLVGHSVGGFNMRVFAARYGDEVAGLVLVDSADEYEDSRKLPRSMQSATSQYVPTRLRLIVAPFFRFAVHAGAMRLLDNGVEHQDGFMTLEDSRLMHALQLQTKSYDASYFEALSRAETIRQVKAVENLGTMPLIVLSGAKKPDVNLNNQDEVALLDQFMFHRVHVTQAHLATLSTKGRQVVLDNVGHAIPIEEPAAIVDAVRNILSSITFHVVLTSQCALPDVCASTSTATSADAEGVR